MPQLNPYSLGYRIRIIRRALSWSQDYADRILNAGKGVVRQHEAGRRRWPRLPLLRRLRHLEGVYEEEIKAYLAVAGNDKRKRIHCQPDTRGRPPDIRKALAGVGAVDTAGSLPQPNPIPAAIAGTRTVSKFASKRLGGIASDRSGHADDTKKRTG
jgi:hypothetical protein